MKSLACCTGHRDSFAPVLVLVLVLMPVPLLVSFLVA